MILLLMGVCGVGKSTVGRLLADELGARYIEGDDFHSPENIAKMVSGVALDDADRLPWLNLLGDMLANANQNGESVVLGCSALKESYRKILKASCGDIKVVLLHGSFELIADRLKKRKSHYMSVDMLKAQMECLEKPTDAIQVEISGVPEEIVKEIRLRFLSVES